MRGAARTWDAGTERQALQAADALPLYLSAATVLDGGDPTDQLDLQATYLSRKVVARAAIFSNLYPASAGVLLQPLAVLEYNQFIGWWRALLMFGAVLAGVGAALGSVRGRAAPLAAAIGLWLATAGFPVTAECISLGQANLLMAGVMAVAMAALARGWTTLAAAAGVLGAGIKLVPAAIFAPMLGGRQWWGLLAGALLGGALALVTVTAVPFDRVVGGVQATLQFQSAISPDWLNDIDAPEWVVFVGDWRHRATQLITVVLVLGSSWAAAGTSRLRPTMAGGVALITAWLGADAAAFHVLYAPLYIPAVVYLATWPLDRDAPRWSWGLVPLAAAPWIALGSPLTEVADSFALTVAGLVVWAGTAVRLLWHSGRLPLLALPLLGLAMGYGAAWGDVFNERPLGPSPQSLGGDVDSYGLPDGVGHGGPAPGEGVLDPAHAAAIGLEQDRPDRNTLDGTRLERVLSPESAQRLTSHLIQGPKRWRAVDDPVAQALADDAPKPPAAHALYGEIAEWMAREHYCGRTLEGTEAAADELERTLRVMARNEQR